MLHKDTSQNLEESPLSVIIYWRKINYYRYLTIFTKRKKYKNNQQQINKHINMQVYLGKPKIWRKT